VLQCVADTHMCCRCGVDAHFNLVNPTRKGFEVSSRLLRRGGGLGSRPKKMYGERLGNGVECHLMKPTTRR